MEHLRVPENSLAVTNLAREYIYDPSSQSDVIELTTLEAKVLVLVVTHIECTILTLVELIRRDRVGIDTPFLAHTAICKVVAGLVKLGYLTYYVDPNSSVNVKVKRSHK